MTEFAPGNSAKPEMTTTTFPPRSFFSLRNTRRPREFFGMTGLGAFAGLAGSGAGFGGSGADAKFFNASNSLSIANGLLSGAVGRDTSTFLWKSFGRLMFFRARPWREYPARSGFWPAYILPGRRRILPPGLASAPRIRPRCRDAREDNRERSDAAGYSSLSGWQT